MHDNPRRKLGSLALGASFLAAACLERLSFVGSKNWQQPFLQPRYLQRQAADKYACEVEEWVQSFVIAEQLCPWAGRSAASGRLTFSTCFAKGVPEAAAFIHAESLSLASKGSSELCSTVVVCPHVEAWRDFDIFDAYMKAWNRGQPVPKGTRKGLFVTNPCREELSQNRLRASIEDVNKECTLVAFHPRFERWLCPPKGFPAGSTVRIDFMQKRIHKDVNFQGELAVVMEPQHEDVQVGPRELCACLHGGSGPSSWNLDCIIPAGGETPLADNLMHSAPHVAVHLIRRLDLMSDGIVTEANDLRLRNSQRFAAGECQNKKILKFPFVQASKQGKFQI